MTDEWNNPEHPPTSPATDHGYGVWSSWTAPWSRAGDDRPLVWHWCNRSLFVAARDRGDESEASRANWWYEPCWVPAGVGGHDLIAATPLHVEPSVFWSDCCGLHGWIRDGKWQSA